MLRRLPISLKFDDEDSDFYNGFIEQKKNDRELSTLILNLLHVYYENESVRQAVDDYILDQSPFMKVHEALERIVLEHNKQRVSTSMLGSYVENEKKSTIEQKEEVVSKFEDEEVEKEDSVEDVKLISEKSISDVEKQSSTSQQSKEIEDMKREIQDLKELVKTLVTDKKTDEGSNLKKEITAIEKEEPKEILREEPKKKEDKVDKVEGEKPPVKKKPKSFSKLMASME